MGARRLPRLGACRLPCLHSGRLQPREKGPSLKEFLHAHPVGVHDPHKDPVFVLRVQNIVELVALQKQVYFDPVGLRPVVPAAAGLLPAVDRVPPVTFHEHIGRLQDPHDVIEIALLILEEKEIDRSAAPVGNGPQQQRRVLCGVPALESGDLSFGGVARVPAHIAEKEGTASRRPAF